MGEKVLLNSMLSKAFPIAKSKPLNQDHVNQTVSTVSVHCTRHAQSLSFQQNLSQMLLFFFKIFYQSLSWLSQSSVPPRSTSSSFSSPLPSNAITRHHLLSLLLSLGGINHTAETQSRLLWIQAVLKTFSLRTTQIMTPTSSVLTVRGQYARWPPNKPTLSPWAHITRAARSA